MNEWTQKSIDLASGSNYLDRLFEIYTIKENPKRELKPVQKVTINKEYNKNDNGEALLQYLLTLDLFPIKDSYIPYLKKDKNAIKNNPATVNRLTKSLKAMGVDEIIARCEAPKESNRQMGPRFKEWIDKGTLGYKVFNDENEFLNYKGDCIYNASDSAMKLFANKHLGFERDKGIDFLAKIKDKYVIAEAKFLSDQGGHQDAQFDDALKTLHETYKCSIPGYEVVPICIADGVLYIQGGNKLYKFLKDNPDDIILSALVLKDFLNSL